MAYLLGNKFCIESLRTDVSDLQDSITDVFSRAGPVSCLSWKYPDKLASDLDIAELLEIYDYTDEEEDRQVAHIALLELVIDRLVLLMQSMSRYIEQTLALGKVPTSGTPTNNTSIGLVVKKYWNKVVHIHTVLQQMHSESKSKSRKVSELENTVAKLTEELNILKGNPNWNPTAQLPSDIASRPATGRTSEMLVISKDEYNKSTQTIETAFIPCDACARVQENLRDVGHNMVDICETQGLVSSLKKYMSQVENIDWLCASDLAHWSREQNKDLTKINKHLEDLMNSLNPLKTDLTATKKTCKTLQGKLSEKEKEVKLERESQNAQRRQFDAKIKDVEKKSSDTVDSVTRKNDQLEKAKTDIEVQMNTLKTELDKQQQCLKELETAKAQLQQDLESSLKDNSQMASVEREVTSLQMKLQDVNSKLETSNKQLTKEKAKNKSVNKHSESLQGKQESLVERLDQLDQENEELRGQVDGLEESKEQLEESLDRAQEQRTKLEQELKKQQVTIKKLNEEKDNLEHSIDELKDSITTMESKLEEAKDHERLLVEYPDLNGPVNSDLTGTGNIAKDMENQVKANGIRIEILEEENAKLRNSITKMLSSQMGRNAVSSQLSTKPVQLWDNPMSKPVSSVNNGWTEDTRGHHQTGGQSQQAVWSPDDSRAADIIDSPPPGRLEKLLPRNTSKSTNGEGDKKKGLKEKTFVVGKSTVPASKITSHSRPNSGPTAPLPAIGNSSIGAYTKLKNAGLLKGNRPQSGTRPIPGKTKTFPEDDDPDIFTCSKCDKMYNSKRDLEIHKSYCFGGS